MKLSGHFLSFFVPIVLLTGLISCKKAHRTKDKVATVKTNHTTNKVVTVKSIWQVDVKASYAANEKVTIRFKNIGEKEATIYDPLIIRVEQKLANGTDGKNWKIMRWLYCPCGASCPPPPARVNIAKNQSKTFVWDKLEKWCDHRMKTQQQKATKGTYRLRLKYQNPQTNAQEIYYQEFNIE